jgi:hypothetical protein
MKYIKNIVLLSMIASFVLVGCDNIDDSRFNSEPQSGWVEFRGSGVTINAATETLSVPIDIVVPTYESGIEIFFEIVPVQGDLSQVSNNNPGTSVFEPAVLESGDFSNRVATIDFDIKNDEINNLTEQVIFDIVLTSTSVPEVSLGLGEGESTITTFRVSTPCPLDYNSLAGVYSVEEVFTAGQNEGLSFTGAFGRSFQMEADLVPDDITQTQVIFTNSRGFDSLIDGNADGETLFTFDTCNGTITFDPSIRVNDFENLSVSSATYTMDPPVITIDGTLGGFGPYQIVLTKE